MHFFVTLHLLVHCYALQYQLLSATSCSTRMANRRNLPGRVEMKLSPSPIIGGVDGYAPQAMSKMRSDLDPTPLVT